MTKRTQNLVVSGIFLSKKLSHFILIFSFLIFTNSCSSQDKFRFRQFTKEDLERIMTPEERALKEKQSKISNKAIQEGIGIEKDPAWTFTNIEGKFKDGSNYPEKFIPTIVKQFNNKEIRVTVEVPKSLENEVDISLRQPVGIKIGKDGDIYIFYNISNSIKEEIKVYDRDGNSKKIIHWEIPFANLKDKIKKREIGGAQCIYLLDEYDNIYAARFPYEEPDKIIKMDNNGKLLDIIKLPGSGRDLYRIEKGWVIDYNGYRVVKVSKDADENFPKRVLTPGRLEISGTKKFIEGKGWIYKSYIKGLSLLGGKVDEKELDKGYIGASTTMIKIIDYKRNNFYLVCGINTTTMTKFSGAPITYICKYNKDGDLLGRIKIFDDQVPFVDLDIEGNIYQLGIEKPETDWKLVKWTFAEK